MNQHLRSTYHIISLTWSTNNSLIIYSWFTGEAHFTAVSVLWLISTPIFGAFLSRWSKNTNDSAEPPCPPPCNVAAARCKNQDSIKMSFVQHCCREGGAPARKRYKIAAESPTLLVTMECRNACKESATSTVITFESQRNIVTQWETQWNTQWNRQWNTPWNAVIYSVSCSWAERRLSAFQRILIFAILPGTKRCKLQRFVVCFTVCAQLGATGPPRQQTWHKKRIPRQAKSTTASMVPGAFQHAEPIKHTNSTCALQEIGCKSNPNMGAETLRKSVQDLHGATHHELREAKRNCQSAHEKHS